MIKPVAFSIFGIDIYWYGIAYFITFLLGLQIAKRRAHIVNFSVQELDYLLNYVVLGVIIGARLGEFLFYHPSKLFSVEIFYVRSGGLSFHGGILGVVAMLLIYAHLYKKKLLVISDLIAMCVPIGSFFGRIANYINQELHGQMIINSSLQVFFKQFGWNRHPVAFYEAFFEGVVLFCILNFNIKKKLKDSGKVSSLFLIYYGIFRFCCEFFRIPDGVIGVFSTAQWLSILMIVFGLITWQKTTRKIKRKQI